MAADPRAAVRAWKSYSGAGAGTRAFLAARLAVLPLGGLDDDLRALRGRVLSVGCGHGLLERYLAEINPHVEVDGLELDRERVRLAQAGAPPRVRVRQADVTKLAGQGGYDAGLAVDLLHHIEPDGQPRVLAALAAQLRPGGTCLVKDIATRPRWQYEWNRLHDRLVAQKAVNCRSPEEMARLLESAGLRNAHARRIAPLSPYPHYTARAEK
jgi:cyclopropane fatty-acyl-phospholipid synthase-like methyltransferase